MLIADTFTVHRETGVNRTPSLHPYRKVRDTPLNRQSRCGFDTPRFEHTVMFRPFQVSGAFNPIYGGDFVI